MKYNFVVDHIDENSTHGKILKQILPNSTVLECGCATGYLTKYMKEKLGCKVYIIEYEQAAFDIAKQYAVDGICTDLMNEDWVNKFQEMKFDYILFADVLEHLYNPEKVLKKASEFLKYDGKIIISLPNIGHNDILMKLYDNHWDYTPTGLLDDTHIRFWGNNNLDEFASQANLKIIRKDYAFTSTFSTEQGAHGCSDTIFLSRVMWRNGGEIYQFILTLQLTSYVQQENIEICSLSTDYREARLYYATQEFNQYSEEKCLHAKSEAGEYLNYRFEINVQGLQSLRFDPIECFGIVVKDIKITSNAGELFAIANRAIVFNGDTIFYDADPSYEIKVPNDNITWVNVSIKAHPISEKEIETIFIQQQEKIGILKNDSELLENKVELLRNHVELLKNEVNSVYNSNSWKITKPLRKIVSFFK